MRIIFAQKKNGSISGATISKEAWVMGFRKGDARGQSAGRKGKKRGVENIG
jgi:hypothetical protein